ISTAVITAGSHSLEPGDFKQQFENYRTAQMQQSGQMMTAQEAVAQGVDVQMIDALTGSEAIAEFIPRLGIRPWEKLVGDEMKKQPSFFNDITGKFDPARYEQVLRQNNLTPDKYLGRLTDQI